MHKMEKTENHYREHVQKERKQGILTNSTFQSVLIGGLISFIGLLLIWVFTHFENNFTMINQRIDKVETRLDSKIDNVQKDLSSRIDRIETKIDNMQKENNEFFKLILLELKKK